MDKKTKSYMLLIAFAVVVYAAAMHLGTVLAFLGKLVTLVLPLIIGLVLAFVLSVPMNGYEKLLGKLFGHPLAPCFVFVVHFVTEGGRFQVKCRRGVCRARQFREAEIDIEKSEDGIGVPSVLRCQRLHAVKRTV